MLPDDYQPPPIGTPDTIGCQPGPCCMRRLPDGEGLVCTLPLGHGGLQHVAHGGNRIVLAIESPAIPEYLRLPEGM